MPLPLRHHHLLFSRQRAPSHIRAI
ncbi:hypothetical protein VCHENC02_3669A, partial [Vibrio harveyi]